MNRLKPYFWLVLAMFAKNVHCFEMTEQPAPEVVAAQSDLIILVYITEGRIKNDFFLLGGDVIKTYKGSFGENFISFKHEVRPYSNIPDKIGGLYTISLKNVGGSYFTLDSWFAVTEIGEVEFFRDDSKLILEKLGVKKEQGIINEEAIFLYPQVCVKNTRINCLDSVKWLKLLNSQETKKESEQSGIDPN